MPSIMTFALATAALVSSLASATPIEKRATCYKGPYVIYARGTDPSQPSPTTNDPTLTDTQLAGIAASGVPDAGMISPLEYPAAGLDPPLYFEYQQSWGIGIDHLQGNITSYVDSCPGSKMVLLGYSQGASVVTGALMGGQGRKPLAAKYINAIAGGVAIADPSFVAGLSPLDNGSTDKTVNGTFQDGNVQVNLNAALGSVFRSFCATGDFFCASSTGVDALAIHANEEQTWFNASVSFLESLDI